MSAGAHLRLQAPAKINLFLRITGRRPDGYHTLISRMQKISLCDQLLLEKIDAGIELCCPDGKSPQGRENLVFRAADLFFAHAAAKGLGLACGARISLQKHIPVAAGLGGGSSDAAATLTGLNDLTSAGLSEQELAALGLQLGADVPFFINQAPAALAQGIGEELSPANPLQGYVVLLVNPGFAVSTRWVYQNFDLTSMHRKDNLQSSHDGLGGGALVNDLEQVTIARYPLIAELKKEMLRHGATAALMSGSGPSVFGLFADKEQAAVALESFYTRFTRSYLVEPLGN